jgi:DNA-binding NtrC family response regulator
MNVSAGGEIMDPEKKDILTNGKFCTSIPGIADSRILIISDNNALSELLEVILLRAGLTSERVRNLADGCEFARSGRFQVVITTSDSPDGRWRPLTALASRYCPGFVLIVVANTFDARSWADAFDDGVFDVLDASHELSKAGEIAKRALCGPHTSRVPGPSP